MTVMKMVVLARSGVGLARSGRTQCFRPGVNLLLYQQRRNDFPLLPCASFSSRTTTSSLGSGGETRQQQQGQEDKNTETGDVRRTAGGLPAAPGSPTGAAVAAAAAPPPPPPVSTTERRRRNAGGRPTAGGSNYHRVRIVDIRKDEKRATASGAKPRASNPKVFMNFYQYQKQLHPPATSVSKLRNASRSRNNNGRSEDERPPPIRPNPQQQQYAAVEGEETTISPSDEKTIQNAVAEEEADSPQKLEQQQQQQQRTLAEQLVASSSSTANGTKHVPESRWIKVLGVPPLSSLEAMVAGVNRALDEEHRVRGILDLDAVWDPDGDGESSSLPFLSFGDGDNDGDGNSGGIDWVRKAKVILSPFGRVTGWKVQLENRSVVYALLMHARENPILCASKRIRVQEYRRSDDDDGTCIHDNDNGLRREASGQAAEASSDYDDMEYPQISDATVRIENCPDYATPLTIMNMFSRFDLRPEENDTTGGGSGSPSIVRWVGKTSDGRVPPATWLVHFADASWARAAVREKQGSRVDGRPITLAQYPKQIL